MEKVNKTDKHVLENDFALRILAVIIAVIVWLILSITQYPTINKTITGVPVDFTLEGTAASEKGLSAINYKDITVDVEISGMNYEIGSYGANDLIATIDLGEVTKEGTYRLDIDVKSAHSSDAITVVSVKPETVEVSFDTIGSGTYKVQPEAPLVSADEGLMLWQTTVSPSEIEVEGPEKELEKIDHISAKTSSFEKVTEDTTIEAEEVIFYDKDGKALDSSVYTLKDVKDFDLNFVIYKKRTAQLSVQFSDYPPGFDLNSLPFSLSEENIPVISPRLDDADMEYVTLGTIPLNEVDLQSTFTFEVDKALSSGEINQTGITGVTVKFDSDGYTTKKFTLPRENITIKNSPVGKEVNIETRQLPEVVICGPEDIVNSLKVSDLAAELDLSDVLNSGTAMHGVTVYSPKNNNVWCCGVNEVQVDITDKPKEPVKDKNKDNSSEG